MKPTIVWFRQDLRLKDNPALRSACARGGPVLPVYIWSPDEEGDWPRGAASRWWLHHSLVSLDRSLQAGGSRLIVRNGTYLRTLRQVITESGVDTVYWNRRYEPIARQQEDNIYRTLSAEGVSVERFNSALLYEPWEITNASEKPFQVFTPFWKSCLAFRSPSAPLDAPSLIPSPTDWPRSLTIDALRLLSRIDWMAGLRAAWKPGEAGAEEQLQRFAAGPLPGYSDLRDRPDLPGVSQISPHLHFGEISPHQVWQEVQKHTTRDGSQEGLQAGMNYLRQLGWREFAYHLLYHFPQTPTHPLRMEYAHFPWFDEPTDLLAWQQGQTGYPLVDAGMRELWTTGWMHNRIRMVVASFLVKDLLIPWQSGARWFWDTLVDADLANNTLGWQWAAGCGADAAPFFRIFNPVKQGEKFDPEGAYIRRWVPELAGLSEKWIHRPWDAPADVLSAAGITLGRTYPHRVVDHQAARAKALQAFAHVKAIKLGQEA